MTDRPLAARRVLGFMTVLALLCLGLPAGGVLAQGSWYGEYFANAGLSGEPVLTRYDDGLNFDWGLGNPGDGVPDDNFSARWTHTEWFDGGTYRFTYRSDDGVRIWVGGTLVVDDWRDRQAGWSSIDHYIPAGSHPVRVEYYDHTGGAVLQVSWGRISGGSAWRGEYFDDKDLSGSATLVRDDHAIDFDWGTGSPDGAISSNSFSVRWTRTLGFTAGTYRFYASCDDGVRIYVDGSRIVDAWYDQKLPNTRSGDIALAAGQHTVVVEYYEHGDLASAHVWWNLLSSFAGWEGRYYDNVELAGGPALIRDDADINFDWGEGPPADWMASDNFSVVWTRQVNFAPGYYRFNVRSDDGVRVWLNGALVMDYWQPQDNAWHYLDGVFLTGTHELTVEYFEGTGSARIRFWMDSTDVSPQPAPQPAPGLPGTWLGEYFNNENLTGAPVIARTDPAIDFNWAWNSPAPEVSRDHFSVRWTGAFHFDAGRYRFNTTTDDGVRLYVDDQQVINAWRRMRSSRVGYLTLTQGTHTVRVEYFEGTQAAKARVTWQLIDAAAAPPTAPAEPPTMPRACVSGPLELDAWPLGVEREAGGYVAEIFVGARGGDCLYTYLWEGQIRGGPTYESLTFELFSPTRTAMVGKVSVASGGQTASRDLYIGPPVD